MRVEEWLTAWSGRRTFERFWLPLLRAKLGESYRESSAAFIWATIQRLYAARRTGPQEGDVRVRAGRLRSNHRERSPSCSARRMSSCAWARRWRRSRRTARECRVREQDGTDHVFDDVVVTTNTSLAARLIAGLGEVGAGEPAGDSLPGHRLRLAVAEAAALSLLPDLHYRRGPVHRGR